MKECCIEKIECQCPDKDGMSKHDTSRCLCPEHFAKHEEWLKHIMELAWRYNDLRD